MSKQLYGCALASVEILNSSHIGERKGRSNGKVLWVILHGTASGTDYSPEATANDFANRGDGVGTHYVVGYNGEVVQCTDENDSAWGSGVVSGATGYAPVGGGDPNASHDYWWNTNDCNDQAICIEHARSSDNMSALSPIQKQASMFLVQDICKRWNIPLQYATEKGGVTGHYSVNPASRAYCPGPGFFHPDKTSDWFIPGALAPGPITGGNGPGSPTGGTSGETNSFSGTGILGTAFSAALGLPEAVHNTITSVPGFKGVVEAVDQSEQFPGIIAVSSGDYVTNAVQTVISTMVANFLPTVVRVLLFLVGVIIVLAIAIKLVNDYI